MRRIIPVICTILVMIIITLSYTKYTKVDTTVDETTETPEVVSTPVFIPSPTPTPIVIVTPEPTPDPTTELIPEPMWWTDYDLDLLAAAIFYEAGSDCCADEHQQLVGQVIINRMNDTRYPDTIYDVITDTKFGIQYSTSDRILRDAGNHDIIPQRCYDNALVVLNGEIECPDDVIFQANFKQGKGIYKIFETPYSTTYFCHG